MPTPTGLPKPGERWKRTMKLPANNWKPQVVEFIVVERGRGDYWHLRVRKTPTSPIELLVDASYFWSRGELEFIGNSPQNVCDLCGWIANARPGLSVEKLMANHKGYHSLMKGDAR